MNEIMNINGIECYEKEGTAYLKLETVARGLGFTRVAASGNEVVRWDTVRKYLSETGVPTNWHGDSPQVGNNGLPEFIPENIFYRLAMKAKNAAAEAFQAKVADEIIPSIRKHGAYMTEVTIDRMIASPEFGIQLLTALKEEQKKRQNLEMENAQQRQMIAEYSPKASYYDVVLQTKDLTSASQISKDYGKSAKWLNSLLHDLGVQYKQGNVWLLYQKYAEMGYTKSKTHTYSDDHGTQHSKLHTYWTQKGRLFIYDLLKQNGYYPLIEIEAS